MTCSCGVDGLFCDEGLELLDQFIQEPTEANQKAILDHVSGTKMMRDWAIESTDAIRDIPDPLRRDLNHHLGWNLPTGEFSAHEWRRLIEHDWEGT